MDAADPRVLEFGSQRGLAFEAGEVRLGAGTQSGQDLQGDIASETRVFGQPDQTLPTTTQLFDETVGPDPTIVDTHGIFAAAAVPRLGHGAEVFARDRLLVTRKLSKVVSKTFVRPRIPVGPESFQEGEGKALRASVSHSHPALSDEALSEPKRVERGRMGSNGQSLLHPSLTRVDPKRHVFKESDQRGSGPTIIVGLTFAA